MATTLPNGTGIQVDSGHIASYTHVGPPAETNSVLPPTTIDAPCVEVAQLTPDNSVTFITMKSRKTEKIKKNMEGLPNELLSHIFRYLDEPQPSAFGLLDEPILEITKSEVASLKAASTVSRRWRAAVIPILFKHSRFMVSQPSHKAVLQPVLEVEIKPFFEFVSQNKLDKVITSFALLVPDKVASKGNKVDPMNAFADFWQTFFQAINPVELLIVSPPKALGALTSCTVHMQESVNFDTPYHYLRLRQNPSTMQIEDTSTRLSEEPDIPESDSSAGPAGTYSKPGLEPWNLPRAKSSSLFEARPWSALLLNEGSFVKVYSTYEFWLRRPPSILGDMLGDDDFPQPFLSPTIRDMSYIAMFPTAAHFSSITNHFPRLDRIYLQLVPRNNILEDQVRMAQVEVDDLWMERNNCYGLLMRELFDIPPVGNFQHLQLFESGDAADTIAWNMAVEYVRRAGNGKWHVQGDGIFVRDPKELEPKAGGEEGEGSSFLWVD